MNDFKAISDIAHSAGALAIGDGVSFAPHRVLDVNTSGLDLYLFHLQDLRHPPGRHVGPSVLDTLEPQGHYFNRDLPHYKFNPAGPLHAEIAALAGIEEYIDAVYDHHFDEEPPDFHTQGLQGLRPFCRTRNRPGQSGFGGHRAIPGARIMGQDQAEAGSRAATIAPLRWMGMRCSDAVKRLVEKGDRRAQRAFLCAALP
jgi:hypothetical protein